MSIADATALLTGLAQLPVHADVLLEMSPGAVAPAEYARARAPFLLRTLEGPAPGRGTVGGRGGRMMRVALLFPGQGVQAPGFLRRLPQHHALHGTLEEARQVLGQNPEQLDGITPPEFTPGL